MAQAPPYFAWELSAATMHQLNGTNFQKRLASILFHTLTLGVFFASDCAISMAKRASSGLDPAVLTHLNRYILNALENHKNKDRYYPLRLTAPSVSWIFNNLTIDSTSQRAIFQLALWRTFAVGTLEHLKALTLTTPEPDFAALCKVMEGFPKKTNPGALGMGVYGQYMIQKKNWETILRDLWRFAGHFASKPNIVSFSEVYQWFKENKPPGLNNKGVVTWLNCCDSFEFDVCEPPTINDLASHMWRKNSGPTKAVNAIASWEQRGVIKNKGELEQDLKVAWDILTDPRSPFPEIIQLQRDCADLQGRDLCVIDLEHALCKIVRQFPKPKKTLDDEEAAKDKKSAPKGKKAGKEAKSAATKGSKTGKERKTTREKKAVERKKQAVKAKGTTKA